MYENNNEDITVTSDATLMAIKLFLSGSIIVAPEFNKLFDLNYFLRHNSSIVLTFQWRDFTPVVYFVIRMNNCQN